jgi:Catalytic LigB subunit of aromatic ring-opening dioxygenase
MLGLGLATSHAPSMFRGLEHWAPIHRVLTGGVPQPPQIESETPEVLRGYIDRISKGFSALRSQVEVYKPDALLVVGDDQAEVFTAENMPTFSVFTCAEVHGSVNISLIDEREDQNHITLRCHAELARYLFDSLSRQGFEISESQELRPLGRPARGIGHAFTRPVVKVTPKLDVPIIPLHVNAYFPPMPSARRCYELGRSIAQALKGRPEKVALMASGGLSHDPRGPRAGWIDTALDRWVLEQLRSGDGESLCHLFEFDSDSLRGGTGEIRSWIVVAGACAGAAATVVDYIAAHHAVTGLGFAYWSPDALARSAR